MFDDTSPAAALVDEPLEQALLGILLAQGDLLSAVASDFHADHLAVEGHAEIFRTILATAEAQPSGPLLLAVSGALAADKSLRSYLAGMVGAAVSFLPDVVTSYAGMLTDLYRRRQALVAIDGLRAALVDRAEPANAVLSRGLSAFDDLIAGRVSPAAVSLDDAIDGALAAADAAHAHRGPGGLSTGLPSIDEQIGGLEPGSLIVLGGRPGMGKSAFGWQSAIAAARQGAGVLAISLEMSATELGRRALSAISGVPVWRLKRGRHTDGTERLLVARRELRGLPLSIEDGAGLTAGMIGVKARAAKRRHGLGLVVIDHLHIVRAEDVDVRQGATWAVGRISGAMKRLAKECGCPVVLLAQLNRAVEAREEKRPVLSDLRQTGDIEQDADIVAFLYRDEYYLSRETPERKTGEAAERFQARVSEHRNRLERAAGKAELIIAKARDGATGTVPLYFNAETTSFAEVPRHA
jgi:replicative DNA helicase